MNDKITEEIFSTILEKGQFQAYYQYPEKTKHAIVLKSKGFLITPYENSSIYVPSKTGEEVLQLGGWENYNKEKDKKKRISDKKEHYEFQMAKLKYYTFWPALFLGSIGGVYSIMEIIKSYKEDNKPKTESIKEQPKSHISSEDHKKSTYPPLKIVDTASVQEKTKANNKY